MLLVTFVYVHFNFGSSVFSTASTVKAAETTLTDASYGVYRLPHEYREVLAVSVLDFVVVNLARQP